MKTKVLIFKDGKGLASLVEWLKKQPARTRDKCIAKVKRLSLMWHKLRRPDCDYLTEGIYELRARDGNVNYRIFYGFVGQSIVLLSHGCTKEKEVPKRQIEKAVNNIANYKKNPDKYSFEFEVYKNG
ncbi:MAG: type II toxin-antitoxin system RelE/ParE family toxin [Planctomycetes bacterium]|nr:type II toxin-antitoxin system RelE/ParE family toxin [Planctomycetota bacterium]